jgi:hypothetical protein
VNQKRYDISDRPGLSPLTSEPNLSPTSKKKENEKEKELPTID